MDIASPKSLMRDWTATGSDGIATAETVQEFDAAAKIAELQAAVEAVIRGKSETVKYALVTLFAGAAVLAGARVAL